MKNTGSRYNYIGGHPLRCYHCNEEGHIAKNCPKKPPQLCFNCGKPGHIKRECPAALPCKVSHHALYNEGHTAPVARQAVVKDAALLVEITGTESGKFDKEVRPPEDRNGHGAWNQPTHGRVPRPFPPLAEPRAEDLGSAKFIDTHCHLEYVFERFKHQGSFADFMTEHRYPQTFEGCITTFCDPTAFSPSFGIWQSLLSEQNVWGTFGTHPHNAKYYHSSSLEEKMLKCLSHPKCVAVGEIGLDYAPHSPSNPDIQRDVLTLQLELAIRLKKPIILHCREAEEDMLEILSSTVPRDWHLHLHCFTGSPEMAKKFLKTFSNLYIGICGNVTHESSPVQAIAAMVPLERMLLETDAPYMVPRNLPKHFHSNKFSHPSLAFYTAKQIAKIRHINIAEVLKSLRENTKTMYGI